MKLRHGLDIVVPFMADLLGVDAASHVTSDDAGQYLDTSSPAFVKARVLVQMERLREWEQAKETDDGSQAQAL